MTAARYSAQLAGFPATDPAAITARLAAEQIRRFRQTEAVAVGAWEETIALLRTALGTMPDLSGRRIPLEYPLLRLGWRIHPAPTGSARSCRIWIATP